VITGTARLNRIARAPATLAFVLFATPALAQEADAAAGEGPATPWSLSLSGGASIPDSGKGDTYQSASITRGIGAGYVSLSGMRSVAQGTGRLASPGSTAQRLTLGGGIAFGQVSLDAYGTIGRRTFKPFRLPLRRISISGTGHEWSVGGSITWTLLASEHLSLSPYVSGDTGTVETARVINGFAGPLSVREKQKGTSGSAGVNLSRSFGPDGVHAFGANLAYATSSNASASSASGFGPRGMRRLRPLGQGSSGGDSWLEYGVSGAFQLGQAVGIDVSADRTAGVLGPESTSVSAGLRYSF
jgi:hypothetical protein